MTDIVYSISNKGGRLLTRLGFIYNKDKEFEACIRWRCQTRGCKGMLTISNVGIIVAQKQHSHPEDFNKIKKILGINAKNWP